MKINYNYIIIGILVGVIILLSTCKREKINSTTIETKTDTVWMKPEIKTVEKIVPIYKTIPGNSQNYIPSKDCDTLKKQFISLREEHIAKNIYKDTLRVGKFGYIAVTDTVSNNKLHKRFIENNYSIPVITKETTITKPSEPRRQLYIGGNLYGDKESLKAFTPGLLYKTKKNQIYQINAGINFDGSFTGGFGMYWKFDFNKKE